MPAIAQSLLSGLIGVLITALLSVFIFVASRKRKMVEYEVFSMALIRFKKGSPQSLQVTVDQSTLTGKAEDKGNYVPVDNAFGFEVTLRNVGNEPVENPVIYAILDDSATILEYEVQPKLYSVQDIVLKRDAATPYILRLDLPYLNDGGSFDFRVVSTGNKTRKCDISVEGLGVKSRARKTFPTYVFMLPSLIMFVLFLGLLLLPPSATIALGGTYSTSRQVDPPIWLLITFIVSALLPTVILIFRILKVRRRTGREGYISWDRYANRSNGIQKTIGRITGRK